MTELKILIDKYSDGNGIHKTTIPGLQCIKQQETGAQLLDIYSPCVCIIAQGQKKVLLEDDVYQYKPSQYLAASVDLPVIGIVTEASEAQPYLCLQIDLDPPQLAELIAQMQLPIGDKPSTSRGMFVGDLEKALLDCALRLARLLETPRDIPLLAPMLKREFFYRLLNTQYSAAIAQFARTGSYTQRIASTIQRLKSSYDQPLKIEDMADWSGMSVSSFHAHFKNVTAMSPLQYQKRLRLVEARRLMITEREDAVRAAYRVGYESASQFSREYARMFGQPPRRDINSLRI